MADLTQAYKQIDWNLSEKKLNTELWGKESDNARGLKIRLINNGSGVTLSSEVMRVNFKKSDGTQVFSNCTISNNFFVLKMSEQVFAVPGIVECELVLQQHTDFVTSPTFRLIVDENLNTDIESSDEFTALQEALVDLASINDPVDVVVTTIGNREFVSFDSYKIGKQVTIVGIIQRTGSFTLANAGTDTIIANIEAGSRPLKDIECGGTSDSAARNIIVRVGTSGNITIYPEGTGAILACRFCITYRTA